MKVILNLTGIGIAELFTNEKICELYCELYAEKTQRDIFLTGLTDHDLQYMRHDAILVNILENIDATDLQGINNEYVIVTIPNKCKYKINTVGGPSFYETIETYLEFTIDEMLSGLGEENKNLIELVDKILVKDNKTHYPINYIKY